MKYRSAYTVIGLAICTIAVLWILYLCHTFASHEVILLARQLTLTNHWQELRPVTSMRTTFQWNELLIEIPEQRPHQRNNHFDFSDTTPIDIEGYLTTDGGEKIQLDKVTIVQSKNQEFIRLSSPALEWKENEYIFRSVALRSKDRLIFGKVVWISYDPCKTKDGVAFPELPE